MKQGTTPTISFSVDMDLTAFPCVQVAITDNLGHKVIIPTPDLTITESSVSITLTQEQTLSLYSGVIRMQIRAATEDGSSAVASNVIITTLEGILNGGVLDGTV